jgi:predicted nucleic acid-binding protein
MLDSGPLGKLAHAKPKVEILAWYDSLRNARIDLIVPEIADFEIRRNLLLSGLTESIKALDRLRAEIFFLPITSSAMLKAAELWADARKRGRPTADPRELDGDVILAAQALEAGAIVATENVGHLGRYVTARDWRNIVVA